jgi:hypothetical protein
VGAPLPSDGGASKDAALVVAIEHYPALPAITGAGRNAADWATFLTQSIGVPRARFAELRDTNATRSAILAALKRAAAQVEARGRLWFVFIGHGGDDLVPFDGEDAREASRRVPMSEVLDILTSSAGQPVAILDTGFDKDLYLRLGGHAERRRPGATTRTSPIVMEGSVSGFLPESERPAFSYLLLGALRGWADDDGDGGVTADEAVRYTHTALRTLRAGRLGSHPELYTKLDCRSLTVLSTFGEKGPDLAKLAPPLTSPVPRASEADLNAAEAAVREADTRVQDAYARYKSTNGAEGIRQRGIEFEPDDRQQRGPNEPARRVRVSPFPEEVARAVEARLKYAGLLGGAAHPKAATLLAEAALSHFFYGHMDRAHELGGPVVDAHCGINQAGYDAWVTVTMAAGHVGKWAEWRDLAALECWFDERSKEQAYGTARPLPEPSVRSIYALFAQAQKQSDAEVARCYWSTVADAYASVLRGAHAPYSEQPSRPEAAISGAASFLQIDRWDDAARMYQTFVRASANRPPGEDPKVAEERHKFAAMACDDFFYLAKAVPHLRPGYSDLCLNQKWRSCDDGDVTDCKGVCPSNTSRCARWAQHADAGIGIPRDAAAAARIWKAICNNVDKAECSRMAGDPSPDAFRPGEFERFRREATGITQRAEGLEELAQWEAGDDRAALYRRAIDNYRAAEIAWRGVVERRAEDHDAPASHLRLAEARYAVVALSLLTGGSPAPDDVASARTTALAVMEASFGEVRKAGAQLLVYLADRLREQQEAEFVRSKGARGFERRTELRFSGEGDARKVVREKIPALVLEAGHARDEYVALVPPTDDLERVRGLRALEAADIYFVYGDLEEARWRDELIRSTECGRNGVGFGAWRVLLSIHNFRWDNAALKKLIAQPSCAIDAETRRYEDVMVKPQYGMVYIDAYKLIEDADRLPAGPEQRAKIKEAAALFREQLDEAPLRDVSAAATLAGAHAYERLGELDRAIALYELYIDRYGSDAVLDVLENGDPAAKPPLAPNPLAYTERLLGLIKAYGSLTALRLSTYDYRRAALAYQAESSRVRLAKDVRLEAARKAVTLAASRGAPGMLRALQKTLAELGAPVAEQRKVAASAAHAAELLE